MENVDSEIKVKNDYVYEITDNKELANKLAASYWSGKLEKGNVLEQMTTMSAELQQNIISCKKPVGKICGHLRWKNFLGAAEQRNENAIYEKIAAVVVLARELNYSFENADLDMENNEFAVLVGKVKEEPQRREIAELEQIKMRQESLNRIAQHFEKTRDVNLLNY